MFWCRIIHTPLWYRLSCCNSSGIPLSAHLPYCRKTDNRQSVRRFHSQCTNVHHNHTRYNHHSRVRLHPNHERCNRKGETRNVRDRKHRGFFVHSRNYHDYDKPVYNRLRPDSHFPDGHAGLLHHNSHRHLLHFPYEHDTRAYYNRNRLPPHFLHAHDIRHQRNTLLRSVHLRNVHAVWSVLIPAFPFRKAARFLSSACRKRLLPFFLFYDCLQLFVSFSVRYSLFFLKSIQIFSRYFPFFF